MNVFVLAFAQDAAPATGQAGPGLLYTMAPLLIIFVIFYFLVLRPDMKRQQRHKDMLSKLKKGDRVVTGGGMRGTVVNIHEKEDVVVLKISEVRREPVSIEVSRSTLTKVLAPGGDAGKHG